MPTFAERLRFLITEKGITLDDLAKDLGITKATISRYQNDLRQPKIELAKLFAGYFNVSVDYLLGQTNERNQSAAKSESDAIQELKKVDPDLLIEMCRAKDLPEEERQKIRRYSAAVIEQWLMEQETKKK